MRPDPRPPKRGIASNQKTKKISLYQTFELGEEYVHKLEKTYIDAVAQNNTEQTYKIAKELGEQYLEVAKLAVKETQSRYKISRYKISAYFAQAIKFGSREALSELFANSKLGFTLLFNVFILALDKIPSCLQQEVYLSSFKVLTTVWIARSERNTTVASAAYVLKGYLSNFYRHEVDDSERRKIMADFLIPKLEEFSPWETNLLASMSNIRFDSFRSDSDELVELITFCKERNYVSQTCLWAYADYFGAWAESYPDEYKGLVFVFVREINQLISDNYFADNEILKDIEFIKWVNKNWTGVVVSAWADLSQDEIFYLKAMQCCQGEEIYVGEALQYIKEISKDFIFYPNEELLWLLRNTIDMGRFEYIKFALTFTERLLKGMTEDASETSWSDKKSLNRRWMDFYNVYSQPMAQLEIILNFSVGQIRAEIEALTQERTKHTVLFGLLELSAVFSSNNNVKVFSALPKIASSFGRLEGMSTALRFKLKSELKQQKKQTEDVIEGAEYLLAGLAEFKKLIPPAPSTTKLLSIINDLATDIKIIIKNSEKDLSKLDSLISLKEETLQKQSQEVSENYVEELEESQQTRQEAPGLG